MIEKIRSQEIVAERTERTYFNHFEVFTDRNGKFQFLIVSMGKGTEGEDYTGMVVDFESGVVRKKFAQKKWKGSIVDIECMRCIVSESDGNLFTIHYDEDFRIKDDYKQKVKRCGDIYETRRGLCVYSESKVAFLSKKIDEVVFFDLKEEKIINIWKAPMIQGKTYLCWIRCCFETVKNRLIIVGGGNDTFILDFCKKGKIKIVKLSGSNDYRFTLGQGGIFFDYGNKYAFGHCGHSIEFVS